MRTANDIGYGLLDKMFNMRVLAGALACIFLAIISITFNFQLGKMLSGDELSSWLLPMGYALLDVAGLFMSGYIAIAGKTQRGRAIAKIWFVFLLVLSLFAAWSYQCALDAKKSSTSDPVLIAEMKKAYEDAETYAASVNPRATLAKMEAGASLSHARDRYLEAREKESRPLDYPASHAVFYVTPYFNSNPEQSMTVTRFVWAAALTLTPLVIIFLVGLERGPSTSTNPQPGRKKRPTVDRSSASSNSPVIAPSTAPQGIMATGPDVQQNVVQLRANNQERSSERSGPMPTATRVRTGPVSGPVTKISLPANLEERITDDDQRFEVVEYLVRRGAVSPSQRAIKALGVGSARATDYLERLRNRDVILKGGRGHTLVETMRLDQPKPELERLIAA